ncbi:hypothetical protein GW17_00052555 [Ensete ventricosum]|nr:hypothetical protein GW17_00052555 [Ensete ventricosum]
MLTLYAFDVHCNSFFPAFVLLYAHMLKSAHDLCIFSSDSVLCIPSLGSTWLLSNVGLKPSFHGGHFILSLSEFSRLRWYAEHIMVSICFH